MGSENLFGVAIRCGQDHPDEYGKMDGQEVKQGVIHNTPIAVTRRCKSDTHQISSSAPVFKIVGSFPTAQRKKSLKSTPYQLVARSQIGYDNLSIPSTMWSGSQYH